MHKSTFTSRLDSNISLTFMVHNFLNGREKYVKFFIFLSTKQKSQEEGVRRKDRIVPSSKGMFFITSHLR